MTKGYEKKLEEIKQKVSQTIDCINEVHPAGDPAQSKQLLQESAEAIKRNDLDQALSLASQAHFIARPTTEHLLNTAKDLGYKGNDLYQDEKLAEAIEVWEQALKAYARVREVAVHRQEDELVKELSEITSGIGRDIEVARRNKANADMHDLIERANKAADEANTQFEAREYDGAREKFETARKLYAESAAFARDFHFDDEEQISATESAMKESIESCLLAKGESLIEAASRSEGKHKEEAFTQTISYLDSFSSEAERYRELREQSYQGLARGRIEIGINLINDAELMLQNGEYYQAKERYRNAQQHFEDLRDFTVEHRLQGEKVEIDRLIEDCAANIRVCTDAMLGLDGVAQIAVRKVEDLRKGIRLQPRPEHPGDDKLSKLQKAYASVRYLDSGGFGEVWLAQTREGQTVALKVLREPEKHEETFFREFQIWERLVHRNIVRLLRARVNPFPLFEMEYVDGGDLKTLIDNHAPLSPERACRIAFDIARGLEHAHASNLIHSDLKPRNILLTKTEEVKISDWGLGKIASSSSQGLGYTPGYAAPEQIQRKPLDRRADAYQIGVILYELLTGDNPFDHGSLAERDEKVLTLMPEKPSRWNHEVEPLDSLITSCLEKEPTNRPGMREIREGLSQYMSMRYGVLLHVTGEINERLNLLCRNALFAAKARNFTECRRTLGDLRSYIGEHNMKEKVADIARAMEYREHEGLEITDEVLNEIDDVLREIEYGLS